MKERFGNGYMEKHKDDSYASLIEKNKINTQRLFISCSKKTKKYVLNDEETELQENQHFSEAV